MTSLCASALILIALTIPRTADAFGVGGYFEYAHGWADLDSIRILGLPFGRAEADFDTDRFGVGVAFDTNLAKDRLFNYRARLGYQRGDRDLDDTLFLGIDDTDTNGFTFDNAFGFGLARSSLYRFWTGPSLRIGLDIADTGTSQFDVVDFSVGGGLTLGVNLHTGTNFTTAITAGYQALYLVEWVDFDDSVLDQNTEAIDGLEHVASVTLTFFFRSSGDRFSD